MKAMRVLNHGRFVGLLVSGWMMVQSSAAFSADQPKTNAPAPGIAAGAVKKLDAQIILALKKSRGEPPFDKPTGLELEPDIPIKDAGRALVDVEAPASKELLDQIALLGGQVVSGSATATTVRAMVPLSQLETLAGRADVKSISPARPTVTSVIKAAPAGVKLGP
jgi:hypothetical protein